MHTLRDVSTGVRHPVGGRAPEGWPPGFDGRGRKMRIPDGGHVALPKQPDGLGAWSSSANARNAPFDGDAGQEARAALLMRPTFVAPLPLPPDSWFENEGIERTGWRRESPVFLLTAVAAEHGGKLVFGVAKTLVVENMRGFGSSEILFHDEAWFDVDEEFEDALAEELLQTTALRPAPEGDATPWTTVMFLVNDEPGEAGLPDGWKRLLQLVAGLYAVELQVRSNAGAGRKYVLHELRSSPPDALLVADASIAVPEVFLGPYRKARPDGYAEILGTRAAEDFREQVFELGMHLRALRGQRADSGRGDESMPTSWEDGKKFIEDLESTHFKLTERARKMLTDNPYADVERMCRHVKALEQLAAKFHENRGNLGRRLEDEAIHAFELDIALFDSDLSPNWVESFGKQYEARPHVKVDDAKAPSECGRIYFAMDDEKFIFVVDHIGLHNY